MFRATIVAMETTGFHGLGDIQLLIFDLDGTLIDSVPDLTLSVNATRRETGLESLPQDSVAKYVGGGMVTLMQRALGRELDDNEFNRALDCFRKYYGQHL